ncbi:MAG: sugar phosphate nucleotidyltransferase [Syntrophobacteraceae bacterium]|nr:sugar phosphate nucleotidyltransferase [Syntrophobacteraceae bacterium]
MKAVIQAGGRGTRLRPYTFVMPKPLMPVGGLAVIEILLKWLCRNGVTEIYITLGYLGHLIRSLCKDGSQWGLNICYSEEREPLGTIGPLRMLEDKLTSTFLVLNGDLIADLNLREFEGFHREQGGLVSVAAAEKEIDIDLGVIEDKDRRIRGFREKPRLRFRVSMGIYCMEPGVIPLIPKGVPFGFDDLILKMLAEDRAVYNYFHTGIWMDIGRHEDFVKAQEVFSENGHKILGF